LNSLPEVLFKYIQNISKHLAFVPWKIEDISSKLVTGSKTLDSTEEMVTWQESGGLIVER